jgi:selenium metabolism protein YedF
VKDIDCRGLNCPEPVLRTKRALEEKPDVDINVIVDNETARENVQRFARSKGRKTEWLEKENTFHIAIGAGAAGETAVKTSNLESVPSKEGPVLLISTDQLGQGSSELGLLLMRNFIYTLTKRDDLPRAIVFMNSGVRLSITGSAVIDELEELASKGVTILVCGTCLDYYELKDEHKAGLVSNMYDITDLLLAAEKVITV